MARLRPGSARPTTRRSRSADPTRCGCVAMSSASARRTGLRKPISTWRVTIGGDPEDLQIMYGIAGERRLPETEIPWLHGYENSRPIRVGNAAVYQRQLDVYGEVIDALFLSREHGLQLDHHAWEMQRSLVE